MEYEISIRTVCSQVPQLENRITSVRELHCRYLFINMPASFRAVRDRPCVEVSSLIIFTARNTHQNYPDSTDPDTNRKRFENMYMGVNKGLTHHRSLVGFTYKTLDLEHTANLQIFPYRA